MSKVRLAVVGSLIGAVLAFAAPVAASRPTNELYFYDCTGTGPTDFYAVKTATESAFGVSGGSAFALIDGSGTYQILSYGPGNADPPGIRGHSSAVNLVCTVDFNIGTTTVYGYFAPTP